MSVSVNISAKNVEEETRGKISAVAQYCCMHNTIIAVISKCISTAITNINFLLNFFSFLVFFCFSSTGFLEILEVNKDGKYIRLLNTSADKVCTRNQSVSVPRYISV